MPKKMPNNTLSTVAVRVWLSAHKGLLLVVLLAFASFVLSVFIFYPGHMSYDSIQQWAQVIGQSPVNDWHPPLMVYIWRLLFLLTGHVSSLLFMQLFIFWFSLGLLSYYCLRLVGKGAALAPFFFGWLPFIVGISGVLWKDVLMAYMLFAASTLLLLQYRARKRSRSLAVLILVLIIGGALLRHNALLAVVPLIVMWSFVYLADLTRPKKAGIVAGIVLFTAASGLILNTMTHAVVTHPSGAIMLDDIVFVQTSATHFESKFLNERLSGIRDSCVRNSVVLNSYWGCLDDVARGQFGEEGVYDGIQKAWLDTILKHPVAYLQYRMYTYTLFLFVPEQRSYVYADGIISNTYGLHERSPYLSKALGVYVKESSHGAISFVFKPWFWLTLSLLVLGLVLLRRIKNEPFAICLLASSIIYIITYFPAVVAADYRYIYWSVLATSLGCFTLFIAWKREKRLDV